MSHLDILARSGGGGDGVPLATVSPAPTGRASCQKCRGTIEKGALRVTIYGKSAFHDGYDGQNYHQLCAPTPRRGFEPKSVSLLPWRDQMAFLRDEGHKAALRENTEAQRLNEAYAAARATLSGGGVKPKDVKTLVEENGYPLLMGPKPIPLDVLVEIAADGLCFGLLPVCPACGSRALRHGGHGLGAPYSVTWCTGWSSASTPCSFATTGPLARENEAWGGSAELRKGKPRAALKALLEAADRRAGREAPEASASPPPRKKAKKGVAPPAVEASPLLRAISADSPLRRVDEMALQEAGVNVGAGTAAQIVVTHEGRTAMNVQLVLVDAAREANKFYRLQCLNLGKERGYAVFSRWGRVGEDDGIRSYNAYGSNKCMLHVHDAMDAAVVEFAAFFKRHTLNDWAEYAAARSFEAKPGCYDLVHHADHALEAEGAGAVPALRAEIGGVGVGAVDVDELDVAELKAPLEAAGAPLEPSVADFVSLIMSKKMLEEELSRRNVDVKKFPLGELSQACVARAYAALNAAAAEVERVAALDSARRVDDVERARREAAVMGATNDFLRAIPHAVGRGGMMATLRLDSEDVIREKLDLVAVLEQILVRLRLDREGRGAQGAPPRDDDPAAVVRRQYASLGCRLSPVPRASPDFATVEAYLKRGWPTAALDALFVADVEGQREAFARHAGDPDVRLLWHGSGLSNWAGILAGGLRIAPPEAPANGYNFDKGLYFADVAAKSAAYCRAVAGGPAVLCLAETAIGAPLEKRAPDVNADGARRLHGKDSVVALGVHEPDPAAGFLDHGGAKIPLGAPRRHVAGDGADERRMGHMEYVVYETARHKIKYVLQCRAP